MPMGWFRRKPLAPPIDDASWALVRAALAARVPLDPAQWARLRELASRFAADKTFTGVQGFEVTAGVRAAIAAQACLPALGLGLGGYRDFVEIVVYPAAFRVQRRLTDEAYAILQFSKKSAAMRRLKVGIPDHPKSSSASQWARANGLGCSGCAMTIDITTSRGSSAARAAEAKLAAASTTPDFTG